MDLIGLRRLCAPATVLPLLLALGLGAGTFAAYAPACRCEFVNYDDDRYVYDNPQVKAGLTWDGVKWSLTTTDMINWHPLTWLSFQADEHFYGLDPTGFHRTNVLLHAADAALLFLALRRLTRATGRSFVAAFFALHPLHVESVAWVSERKDVLSTLFGFLALYAYARYAERPGLVRYLLAALALALSLMAKPMLVTLPCLLLLLDYWPLQRVEGGGWRVEGEESASPSTLHPPPSTLLLEKLPLLLPVAASCAVTMYAQHKGGESNPLGQMPLRLENAAIAYVTYLGQTFWPRDLVPFYPFPRELYPAWQVAGAVALLAAVSALALFLAKRCPYLLVGWLWYLGALAPVIGVIQVYGGHALADRYTYVPLIGLFVMLVWAGDDLCARLRLSAVVPALTASALLAGCLLATRAQIGYWHDNFALWNHTLQVDPQNHLAYNNLGVIAYDKGKIDEAKAYFEASLRACPTYDMANANLALICWNRGDAAAAERHWQAALVGNPHYTDCRLALAWSALYQGRVKEAVSTCEEAVRIDPESAVAHYYLGMTLLRDDRPDEAFAQFGQALKLNPRYADAHQGWADALLQRGEVVEAGGHYAEALRINPGLAACHAGLAAALLRQGQLDEAGQHARAALDLSSREAEAWYTLGVVCAVRGEGDRALKHFQQAAGLQPNTARYAYAVAGALQDLGQVQAARLWYMRGSEQRDTGWLRGANDTAWALATRPDPAARNGPLAVWLARQACAAASQPDPDYLDTLAAAYAEVGRFDKAEEAAEEARAILSGFELTAEARAVEGRLARYRKHEAFRTSAGAGRKWELPAE